MCLIDNALIPVYVHKVKMHLFSWNKFAKLAFLSCYQACRSMMVDQRSYKNNRPMSRCYIT